MTLCSDITDRLKPYFVLSCFVCIPQLVGQKSDISVFKSDGVPNELPNDQIVVAILFITLLTFLPGTAIFANISKISSTQYEKPVISDPNLDIELVYEGITKPTDIEFLGDDDIL